MRAFSAGATLASVPRSRSRLVGLRGSGGGGVYEKGDGEDKSLVIIGILAPKLKWGICPLLLDCPLVLQYCKLCNRQN
jgi:hypothetical protein